MPVADRRVLFESPWKSWNDKASREEFCAHVDSNLQIRRKKGGRGFLESYD